MQHGAQINRNLASEDLLYTVCAATFNADAFRSAMSVVLAHAAYLPSAQCFALLPLATLIHRTGRDDAAQLDFDLDNQTASVTAARAYRYVAPSRIASVRVLGEPRLPL